MITIANRKQLCYEPSVAYEVNNGQASLLFLFQIILNFLFKPETISLKKIKSYFVKISSTKRGKGARIIVEQIIRQLSFARLRSAYIRKIHCSFICGAKIFLYFSQSCMYIFQTNDIILRTRNFRKTKSQQFEKIFSEPFFDLFVPPPPLLPPPIN